MRTENNKYILAIVIITIFLIICGYIIYLISYEEGYYDAKQEDYCSDYCWKISSLDILNYRECNSYCMDEDGYTNYWHWEEVGLILKWEI